MNVLEKILEEIEEKRESLVDMSDDEMELCDVEDWYDEGVKAGRMKTYLDVAETIRSHMDEASDMHGKILIDANALDEEVRNFFLAITGNPKQSTVVRECKESFRKMIDEQPTVYEVNDWIPVEERLPEEGEKIFYDMQLVTLEDGEVCLGVYRNQENEWWTRRQQGEERYTNKHDVVAWQPLPKPYKGGEE